MRVAHFILLLILVLATGIFSIAARTTSTHDRVANPQAAVEPSPTPRPPPGKHPKISSSIIQLIEAATRLPRGAAVTTASVSRALPAVKAYLDQGLMSLDDAGRLQVFVRLASAQQDLTDELAALGAILERTAGSGNLIQARVPVNKLLELAADRSVVAVTLPAYGHLNVGSRITQGDALLALDDLRATFGVDGTGVTVGVISDGIGGLADAIAAGDLPASSLDRVGGKLIFTSGGVIATSFRADGDLEGKLGKSFGSEGTAILEIVHDIAPGAQLRFANFNTGIEFNDAVNFLAANSDVVIDDIGFFGMPYDQTSLVSANTAAALNNDAFPIRGYYTSVGNQALRHYQDPYVSSGNDGMSLVGQAGNFHTFASTDDTADCFQFGPTIGNTISVGPGQTATVILTWDDAIGAVTADYDLYVIDNGSGSLLFSSISDNPAIGDPVETVAVKNSTQTTNFYDLYIQNFDHRSAVRLFDMFVLNGRSLACSSGTNFNYNTVASSVPAQSDSGGGVISVGAIAASDPGSDDIQRYSSHGPTNNGATKPDVTAIDGVSVTGSGGFPSTFFGTSAAAPHVAALAALLLELRPGLMSGEAEDDPQADRAALRSAISGTAVDLGPAGLDNTFGSGRINGLSAGESLTAIVPTPTPTPQPASIPAAGPWGLMLLGLLLAILFRSPLLAARQRSQQTRSIPTNIS